MRTHPESSCTHRKTEISTNFLRNRHDDGICLSRVGGSRTGTMKRSPRDCVRDFEEDSYLDIKRGQVDNGYAPAFTALLVLVDSLS